MSDAPESANSNMPESVRQRRVFRLLDPLIVRIVIVCGALFVGAVSLQIG
jgi:hypothetical protein